MSEPRKLCECGCGKPTAISKYTDCRTGAKKGQPNRFIRGHAANIAETFKRGRERSNAKRASAVAARTRRIEQAHEGGTPWQEIADAEKVSFEVVAATVYRARQGGKDLAYRNVSTTTYLTGDLAEVIARLWSKDELSYTAIAQRMEWDRPKVQTVIAALRRAGYKIDSRQGRIIELSNDEKRAVAREYKKRKLQSLDLPPGQRMIIRLLQATKRPEPIARIMAFLEAAGEKPNRASLDPQLRYMAEKGLVARVDLEKGRWFEQCRWFVPLGAEQAAENLTLADAERETELAALIESQQDELKRGDWIDSEKGHWADKSLDAPLAGTEDFTILDTLGAEDEELAELIGEAA